MTHGSQSFSLDKIQLVKTCLAHSASPNPDSARILKEGISTLKGSTTSISYTKENRVAPVEVRTKVR